MLRIGVTGPHGRLGSELVRQGCIAIEADVTRFHGFKTALETADCDVIVHCAAMTDVDACECAPAKIAEINTGGVANLLRSHAGRIIYISTDYIFDGRTVPSGPYCEDSPPSPLSIYGWSKLGGELVLRNSGRDNILIVRTTVLFDGRSGCFVDKVLTKLLRDEFVYVPDDLFGSPTYIPHLATDILLAIKKNIFGTLNLAGIHVLSRYHFARIIAEAAGISPDLVRRSIIDGAAPRPRKAGLATNRAHKLGFLARDPTVALQQIVAERKEKS